MARKATKAQQTIDEIIKTYAANKETEKTLKKDIADGGAAIKDFLRGDASAAENKKASKEANGWIATLSIEDTATANEARMIAWLKENGYAKEIVKRKECVDGDALEAAIYNGTIPRDLVADMDSCYDHVVKEVLRIKKAKGDE